jgi:molecular chaperone HscB
MSVDLSCNHFELFGLPPAYLLDRTLLDERYRELQRKVHPDRYASAGDQERRISMQQAAQLNEGYQVLKDPLRRGRYLLELRGHAFNDEQNTTRDTGFLMEQMELRERLAEVRDAPDPLAEIGALLGEIQARFQALDQALAAALAASDHGVPEAAVDQVLKMQFYRKLEQEAQALAADLEDELI